MGFLLQCVNGNCLMNFYPLCVVAQMTFVSLFHQVIIGQNCSGGSKSRTANLIPLLHLIWLTSQHIFFLSTSKVQRPNVGAFCWGMDILWPFGHSSLNAPNRKRCFSGQLASSSIVSTHPKVQFDGRNSWGTFGQDPRRKSIDHKIRRNV